MKALLIISMAALVFASATAAAKPLEGSISGPNEAGPYQYGDSVTFSTSSNLKGNNPHPMVELACYQDLNGDNEVTLGLFNGDLAWVALQVPGTAFVLGDGTNTTLDRNQPASCQARLLAYGWKGGQQSIQELAAGDVFEVGP